MQSNDRLFDEYGDDTTNGPWAIVTGGSDGIGLEMCHNLAK